MFGGFCQRGIVVRDIIRQRKREGKGDDKQIATYKYVESQVETV